MKEALALNIFCVHNEDVRHQYDPSKVHYANKEYRTKEN